MIIQEKIKTPLTEKSKTQNRKAIEKPLRTTRLLE